MDPILAIALVGVAVTAASAVAVFSYAKRVPPPSMDSTEDKDPGDANGDVPWEPARNEYDMNYYEPFRLMDIGNDSTAL